MALTPGTRLGVYEGDDLSQRVARGAVPLDEALPIAKQIADALEAAHEQGIIHRDLKPANVKVRPDGTVKVLDFGLAKAMEPAAGSPSLSMSPTLTTPAMTQAGMILGTAAYMSPEQAKGRVVDRRADIWAFGLVLYEMLTGQRLFSAETIPETLAHVLTRAIDLGTLPATTPRHIRTLIARCLVKEPKHRLRDIGEARLALDGAFETAAPPVDASAATAAPAPVWRQPVPVAATALVGGLVVALAAWAFTRPAVVPADLIRLVIVPPDDAPMSVVGNFPDLAVSPDGTLVVYTGTVPGGGPQLHLRPMDQVIGTPLRGADAGTGPFFSPDGAGVGFVDVWGTTLKKVSTFGGPPVPLAESPTPIYGASWSADDQIVFGTGGPDVRGGLSRVSGGGGEAEVLTTPDAEQGDRLHGWPFIIPGRDAVVFVISTGVPLNTGQLAVLDLGTSEVRRLGLAGVSPHYVSTGHLVYAAEDGSVRAVPFDVASLTVTGTPVPLVEGVAVKLSGAANFSVSDNGRLVYALGASDGGERRLSWVDRAGRAAPIAAPPAEYLYPRLSPDGGRVALDARGEDAAIWIWDFVQETRTRLIVGDGAAQYPVWTPDGARIAYARDRVIDWRAANNTGTAERLADPASDGAQNPSPYFFTPDGAALVFRDPGARDTRDDLAMIPVAGGEARWRLRGGFNERNAELSPNGRWMAYESDASGAWQISVRPFPQVDDDLVAVSNDGGRTPLWSRDGRELFYLRPGSPDALISVAVDAGGATGPFAVGERTALFDVPYVSGPAGRSYDVAPDGQRFLVLGNARDATGDAVRPEITVVLNWTRELLERVPVP